MIFDLHPTDILILFTISLSKFTVGFITSMVIPIFPTLISQYFNPTDPPLDLDLNRTVSLTLNTSFNYQQLSILFAAKNFGQIFICPIMGYFCGLLGSLNILLLGVVFQITTMLFYGLGNRYFLLIFGRILESCASAAINCSVSSFVAYRYTDHRKLGFVYGIGGLCLCLGGAMGPAYGGWMFQYYGKFVAFLFVLIMMKIEMILVISLIAIDRLVKNRKKSKAKLSLCIEVMDNEKKYFENELPMEVANNLPELNHSSHDSVDKHSEELNVDLVSLNSKNVGLTNNKSILSSKHNILHFFLDPYFVLNLGAFPVMFMALFIYYATLPQFMRLNYGATESQQGIIWLLNLLGYFFGFFIGNFLNTKLVKYRHIVLMGTVYLEAFGAIFMFLMPNWWSVSIPLCFIVTQHLIFEIVIAPLLASIVKINHCSKFGMMSGIIMMTIAITSSLGSFLGPILFSKIGFRNLNIIIFSMGMIYGPFLLFLKRFV